MSVPNTVLYFTAYDEISIRLRQYHANNLAAKSNTTEQQLLLDKAAADDAKIPAHIPLVAGSTARLLATFATAPLELIRTRQASFVTTQPTRNGGTATASSSSIVIPGMMEEFKLLTRTRGISSLYAGLAPTLWRDVPFSAFYWLFFERFRSALSNSSSSADTLLGRWGIGGGYYHERGMKLPPSIEAMHAFVAGAAAGSIAAAFTT
jgi:solute carrier family 25 protein 39/40